ncbi:MAG: endonuclease/exonuclease/phosphatase family protein [Verrucomicrobia bacterium]|nr:endonuclease/exonuclease/phosphatase family protein [Verrucomicrobiota bacterium]
MASPFSGVDEERAKWRPRDGEKRAEHSSGAAEDDVLSRVVTRIAGFVAGFHRQRALGIVGFLGWIANGLGSDPSQVRVATYNLENYVIEATASRTPKSEESKAKVVEILVAAKPDVLAIQEIGPRPALMDLQSRLHAAGLDLPHFEHAPGFDTNVFVGVLSRYPIVRRSSHTNENFLLHGRRFRVSRAFAEVDIQVNPRYRFTLLTAHLKSKRQSVSADESDLREQEARLLREKIDQRLRAQPAANLVVAGDLNDSKDSRTVRSILGVGRLGLVDTRPAELHGDSLPAPGPPLTRRNVTWTHFYAKEDSYSRIDYLLVSQGMAREWVPERTWIQTAPHWGMASDHRLLVATFSTQE